MKIESHLEKISRLTDLRHRLDPIDDFELWFWSSMVAGTSAVNVALHHVGITPAEDAFPSQPGVYYVKAKGEADYHPVLKAIGDIMHVGRPPIKGPIPSSVQTMMTAMEDLEHFRDSHTRGEAEINADVVKQCEEAYAKCIQFLRETLAVEPK